MSEYVSVILFFLPAAIGNTTPVFVNRIPFVNRWNTPLDFGYSWRGKRLLGDNKRLRGIVFGTLVAGVASVLISTINTYEGSTVSPLLAGCLLGFGALMGDALESFIKRQRGLKPGQLWFPFDQVDYIIGALVVLLPFVRISPLETLAIFVFFFGLHIVFTYIGYLLKLRDAPI